jgi:hypothetical protein
MIEASEAVSVARSGDKGKGRPMHPSALPDSWRCGRSGATGKRPGSCSRNCFFAQVSVLQPSLHAVRSAGVKVPPSLVAQADIVLQALEQVLLLPHEARVRAAINPAARIRVRFAMGLPWFANSERRASLSLSPMGEPDRRP